MHLFLTTLCSLIGILAADSVRSDLLDVPVFITNRETGRLLFSDGEKMAGLGDEGGWLPSSGYQAPKMLGTDANYYNRARFMIVPAGPDQYVIRSLFTDRFVFSDGPPMTGPRGAEGGWLASSGFQAPPILGTDENYYNRAVWKVEIHDGFYEFVSVATNRLIFSDGEKIKGTGAEGGWLPNSGYQAPDILGADANYYNRAMWTITRA